MQVRVREVLKEDAGCALHRTWLETTKVLAGLAALSTPHSLPSIQKSLNQTISDTRTRLHHLREPQVTVREQELLQVDVPFSYACETSGVYGAIVVKPIGQEKRPTVLLRTPYGKHILLELAGALSERGYVVVCVDCRGRYESKGSSFFPIKDETADAEATIEWVMNQPWYDGQIGVAGESYNGFCAFAALGGKYRDKITCIVPVVSTSRLHSVVYGPTGAVSWELCIRWIWLVIARMKPATSFAWKLQTLWHFFICKTSSILDQAYAYPDASDIDRVFFGQELDMWQDLLRHPTLDSPWWSDKNRLCTLQQDCPPMHIFTGWQDLFFAGALEDFFEACKGGASVQLTIGDVSHWDVREVQAQSLRGTIDFFDLHMQPTINQADSVKSLKSVMPIRCQLQGSDNWVEMTTFPPTFAPFVFYLGHGMQLHSKPVPTTPLSYTFDPNDPTPAVGGASFHPRNCGRMNQRSIEERHDVLVFTSEAAASDRLYIGKPEVVLYVKSDLEHFDIVARLCVVHGRESYNICDAISRFGRYEHGQVYCTGILQDDGSLQVKIELGYCAFRLLPGQMLRLQVCSGAHPRWLRNSGTGELFRSTGCVKNKIQLFCDPSHPSTVSLPEIVLNHSSDLSPTCCSPTSSGHWYF